MTFIEEAVISGFISLAINNCVDISWINIKKIIKNNKCQNFESQIYNIIIGVLNQITYNKYKNDQDRIYQSAEKLLVGCMNANCINIEVVRSGLQVLGECINDDKYVQLKILLYQEISKDDYEELYRVIELCQRDEERNKTVRIEHGVDEIKQDIREIKQFILNETEKCEDKCSITQNTKFQNNKKQDYIKKWNSRLFLHLDNDENPITLAKAFIMPDYDIDNQIGRLKLHADDTFNNVINKFFKYKKTLTMLITGAPGIGKSSIISWIANKYKDDDRVIILRFRDWDCEELENGLVKSVCSILECKRNDLNNKILIIDGFDEMKCLDKRDYILDIFLNDIKDFENIKLIITSRPAYINSDDFQIKLKILEFDIERVRTLYKLIKGKNLSNEEAIEQNLDIMGIPVILYMAIMSDVDLNKSSTKPEIFNRVFAKKGGIFDKFSYDGTAYDIGSQILRDPKNIKKYLSFLQEVAFKMFEKGRLSLLEDEYQIPELIIKKEKVSILEFPIRHLFENYMNIEFVHTSIYEYFVSDYIFVSICEMKDMSNKNLAGILGYLLKSNVLSNEILEFLEYKIRNEADNKFDSINDSFQLMLHNGMTYYIEKGEKNILCCEMRIFANMLDLLHLWKNNVIKINESICNYLNCNIGFNINLKKIDLRGIHLNNMDLRGVNLEYANLMDMDLRRICLERANLENAKLDRANLCFSNLKEINLINASLTWADLSASDIRLAKINNAEMKNINFTGSDLRGSDLSKSNLEEAWLNGAWLGGVDLNGAILRNAELRGADLDGTNLEKANLREVDFTFANLKGANLKGAELVDVKLIDADIQESIWLENSFSSISSQLRQANFSYILVENESERRKVYKHELLL